VGIPITKPSLVVYKKQKRYNKWEFVYNPIEEQMQGAGLAGVGGGAAVNGAVGGVGVPNGTTQPMGGSGSPDTGTGNSSSDGNSDGNSGAFGSTPPSANPQQPQR
jgi:hypothetical protein